ncbi:DUF6049 family protein [Streptomyces poonensis]|uniref:Uncharacterized protein n=1 Tax=Streptomyces poonensis TaxID=68255 RepID=A0A918PVV4_9ACTN|nr:DUF6049 family protein [Streptomyces poonensis]GGZ23664.1 hypothetical protein GCM10010365_49750 [Streptomyces poonensis]GLJ89860.1 hypothetical protein GCM10017589_24610 [Streptomyces poonensis]
MAEAADIQGMSSSPARRWLRRTGALLAGAPLLAGLLQLSTAPGGHAAEKTFVTDATGSSTVDVSLNSLSPSAPTDGDTITVSGTVRNNGRQAVTDAHVGLRVGTALSGRAAIDDAAKRTGFNEYTDGAEIGGKYVEEFSRLAPGVAQTFSISVPVKELDLGSDGVYQLGVSLSGRTPAASYEQVLGIQRTFLPWQPDPTDTRTRTTYLWPLISTTHLTAETGPGEQQTPVFQNDDLTKEISPGGRLERMLALGKDLDVTWVIDPDLLASVDAMTRAYQIKTGDTTTTAGKDQAIAKQWLAELQEAVADEEVIALPFADPDLASLAHNGRTVTGSLSHLKDATDVAADTVETVLHVEPDTDFAWPVEGAVDPSIVKVATSAGADKVIARSDSLKESTSLTYTPNAARPIGGGTTAVVADAQLSTSFQGDMTKAGNSTVAVQRFLAHSLMITLQNTGKQRNIVIAPQRMPSVSQAQTMAQALTALQDGSWAESQELAETAAAKPDPAASTKVPSASAYPSSLRKQELPTPAFQDTQDTESDLDRFKVILTNESRVVTPFGRTFNREMSASWRGRTTEAQSYREDVQSYLDNLAAQVRLIEKSETKLSGRSATIPVTVQNNLVQGVDKLVLRLTSKQPKRLEIGDSAYSEQIIEVSGGHSQSVKFDTNANANGEVAVEAQLFTEAGEKYGPPVTFDVNVTEITPTVMLVIAGGVLLLVLAGFRMYTQRKRAAARQAQEDASGETATGEPDGTEAVPADDSAEEPRVQGGPKEPEHPSDPTPDTAPESADRSGTGERVDR